MNCKQGDLAIVIGNPLEKMVLPTETTGVNLGKMVTCLELLPAGFDGVAPELGPLWRTDRPLIYSIVLCGSILDRLELCLAPDFTLSPINPNPEEAEPDIVEEITA
jgi:hypothetical protein